MTTSDEDRSQSHSYVLINDAGGRFVVANGNEIRVSPSANLDYERAVNHTIVVMSTDNGQPTPRTVTKSFVVTVINVNERPTSVHLDFDGVAENSGVGTSVGKCSTLDPDNARRDMQTFLYVMVDDAGGRFELDGNIVRVAASNVRCLASGDDCLLDYEKQTEHAIVVRATDSGTPPLSVNYTLVVRVTDVNDRPRDIELSNNQVFENEPVGFVVGTLSAIEEDRFQTLSYSLLNDDGGRFVIVGNELRKAIRPNYETGKAHVIVVEVRDNGTSSLTVRFGLIALGPSIN